MYPPDKDADMNRLPYWDSIEQVGIGAIPLLSSKDERLGSFLAGVLDPAYPDLYKPGPAFEPYESILRQKIES